MKKTLKIKRADSESKSLDYKSNKIHQLEQKIFCLQQIIKELPGSIYWKDLNGVYLGRNAYAAEISKKYGMEPKDASIESIIRKTDYDYLPREIANKYREHDLKVINTGKELIEEEILDLPNKKRITQLSIKKPLYDESGKIVGVIGNTIDITDRKQLEELRQEKNLTERNVKIKENFCLKNVLKEVYGSIYWKDLNGIYLGRNAYAAEMCKKQGLEPKEASIDSNIGKTDYDYVTKEVADKFRENDLKVINTGKELIEEEVLDLPNGEKIIQLSIKRPLRDEHDKIIGIIGNTIDITDRKKAEELRIQNETAEKVIKFTNLMAGSMAHELRTPLASINTFADLFKSALLSNITPEEKENTCLEIYKKIKRVIKATTHMINDMLIKLKSFAIGKLQQSNLTKLEMGKSIEKFMKTYPFEEKERKLVTIIANEDFLYNGDEILTEHLLSNLVKNALKVIRENGWKGDITIELKMDNDYNKLFVRDTAIGISQEYLPKIFDQFETTNSKSGGTGLGLAFCKMVMEYYGGTITCNSEEEKYAEFVLSFPKV